MGALSGSREPSPSSTGLGPSGFDPERGPFLIWSRKRHCWHRRDEDGGARGYTLNIADAGRFDAETALEYGDGVHNDAIPLSDALAPRKDTVTITREVYDFLMGAGPLEGVWFNDLHKGLPGRFWWRGVLASAAGWPEPAIAMEARQGGDVQQAPSRSDDSAGPTGIAQGQSPSRNG